MSAYEAKAYVALVAAGEPINGYEVAKRSGVPRSTVYETLGKLVARGAAFEVADDEGRQYLSLPPESLLRRIRTDVESTIDALSEALPAMTTASRVHLVHNLQGREAVVARALDLIHEADDDVYLSVWSDELGDLEPALVEADGRRVDVSALVFGDGDLPVGHVHRHTFSDPDIVLDRVGCRLLILAVDHTRVLIGGAVGDTMWGLFSEDPAVVLVAIEFIRHDIAFQALVAEIGPQRAQELFSTDPTLQHLMTGRRAPRLALS
jgi:sugar-specific transcriptional regulator TrmB